MLTRLIPAIYVGLIEITLWLVLLLAGLVGYVAAVPAAKSPGWVLANEVGLRFGGAMLCVAVTFLVACVFVGPLLVLVDIRRSVKAIEASSMDSGVEDLRPSRAEPSFKL
jgi:hypothetical protein